MNLLPLDKIYVINLDKRPDRWKHIETNFIPFLPTAYQKIVERAPGIDYTHFSERGRRAAGASQAHLNVWSDAIKNAKEKNRIEDATVFICEDDISWTILPDTIDLYFDILNKVDFDMISLDYRIDKDNQQIDQFTDIQCIKRVRGGVVQCSAYIAKVKALLAMYDYVNEGVSNLFKYHDERKDAIDVRWQKYQPLLKWFILVHRAKYVSLNRPILTQIRSYSDIRAKTDAMSIKTVEALNDVRLQAIIKP